MATATSHRKQARPGRPAKARAHLIRALESILAQGRTLAGLSVDELVEAAGIARSTFYLNYRDKADLVARLLDRVADEITTASGLWFDNPEQATPADAERALQGIIRVYQQHRAIMNAVIDTAVSEPDAADALDQVMTKLCQQSRQAVASVQAAGRARANLPDDLPDVLTWMVIRCCRAGLQSSYPAEADRLAATMAHVCCHAIFPDSFVPRVDVSLE